VTTTLIVLIVVVVLVLIGAAVAVPTMRRRRLQQQFGPEYERTVESAGDRREAEKDLHQRAQRRKELEIRPLDPVARDGYAQRWRSTQERFVDAPTEAVGDADALVQEVMRARGYPVGDFEQQARDVSVDHADVVSEYHAAHDISQLNARRQASTEQLREAMVHYRALFAELLDGGGSSTGRAAEENVPGR
jgi:hypothetical protein